MAQSFSPVSFEFVISSSNTGVSIGQDTRRLIRQQAMRKIAAARKQSGTWGQHNRRQFPVEQLENEERPEVEIEATTLDSARAETNHQQQGQMPRPDARTAVPASVPSSGYESMRILYGFDILDLSALTTFHTGRITAQLLSKEPSRLASVLRYRQWSYISFLPSRYGHSICLDNAAHCVAARVRQWMSSPSAPPNNRVLSLYSKSLASLQSALNDPILCLKPETLCATAILAIYELLDGASDQPWVRHVAGASALMKLRGPRRYQTDFEKALFLAQAGPVYTEALLNDDVCFLEQEVWQNVFKSAVFETDTLSDSSAIVVLLWTTICPIPSIFKDVQNAICNTSNIEMHTIACLFDRVRVILASLFEWRRRYKLLYLSHNVTGSSGHGKQFETLGIYMANLILINRLSVSLDPRTGSELEHETQQLANETIRLEQRASTVNPRASLFMAFKTITAQVALDTKDDWQQAIDLSIEDHAHASRLISRQVFENWVRLKSRKISVSGAVKT